MTSAPFDPALPAWRAFDDGRAATHALLVSGPPAAAGAAAETLLRRWLCEAGGGDPDCDCRSCRTAPERHPDRLRVAPEGKHIGREQLLPAAAALAERPLWAPHRVAWVAEADKMTPQAQSFLLKHLEEPAPRARWILTAEQPARILPTVRSRCQWVRLPPAREGDVSRPDPAWFTDRERLEVDVAGLARLARRRFVGSGDPAWLEVWEQCLHAAAALEQNGNRDLWRERLRMMAGRLT